MMKRFVSAFLITILLGVLILYGVHYFQNKEKKEQEPSISYQFNVDYATTIKEEELEEILKKEEVILFIGDSSKEASAKVSTFLGEVVKDYSLKVYYLEYNENLLKKEIFQSYEKIEDYLKFNPVILIFKNNKFINGYPGEAAYKNIVQFLEYNEVIKENKK